MNPGRIWFRRIGGTNQLWIRDARALDWVLQLDPARWAALCVPTRTLNADPRFLAALDPDGNGMIRVDEVLELIRECRALIPDLNVWNDRTPALNLQALAADGAAVELGEFARQQPELAAADGKVTLERVQTLLEKLRSGGLHGDGILHPEVPQSPEARALYAEVRTRMPGGAAEGLEEAALDAFLDDAKALLAWRKATPAPLFRNEDAASAYAVWQKVDAKLEEYFRFCALVALDPVNQERFRLHAEALPALELTDSAAVQKLLEEAPLALPDAAGTLDLAGRINPVWKEALQAFARQFNLQQMTMAHLTALREEFADYTAYLEAWHKHPSAECDLEQLAELLNGHGAVELRHEFEQDRLLAGRIALLERWRRLLLCKQYLLEFLDNFVSFGAFFDVDRCSMLQAGRLVMDGRNYYLNCWVADPAEHKKIAVRSHICLFYVSLIAGGAPKNAVPRHLAVGVTAGTLARIYTGKPVFFLDHAGHSYHGWITDIVEGPISFGESLFAPFRRLAAAVGERVQKLTDFSEAEKNLEKTIATGKPIAPPPPPPAAVGKGLLPGAPWMLLAGGLSVAAIGAAASFVLKAVTGMMECLTRMSYHSLLMWTGVIVLLILVPLAINTWIKLGKRDLALFLEAGGWAVNLPMKFSVVLSAMFTRQGTFPKCCGLSVWSGTKRIRRRWLLLLVLFLLVLAGTGYGISRLHKVWNAEKISVQTGKGSETQ